MKDKLKVSEIEVKKIDSNPYQTRLFLDKEKIKVLARSIRDRGLFNPITILQKDDGKYIVVHGHRRLQAYRVLKRKAIPAFVKKRTEQNSLITDLIHENLVREDLSIQEKALSIKLLFSQIKNIKDDLDQIISCITGGKLFKQRGRSENGKGSGSRNRTSWNDNDMFKGMQLIKTIGMSENNAISYLNVLKLPTKIQKIVRFNVHNDNDGRSCNRISIRMANVLSRVDDIKYRDYLLEKALHGTNARVIDVMVSDYKKRVLSGEWDGFVRKSNNSKILKGLDKDLFIDISNKFNKLAKKLNSWKLTKLSALSECMEKEIFISSARVLRNELRLLDNQIKKRLKEKGYMDVEKKKGNEIFEIMIKEANGKKMVRGTIPFKILRSLGFTDSKDFQVGRFLQVKIVGIKE